MIKKQKSANFVSVIFKFISVVFVILVFSAAFGATGASSGQIKSGNFFMAKDSGKTPAEKIVVYYFHGDFRCSNCIKIEKYVKESVYDNFSKEIQGKSLQFCVINVDEAQNNHFVKDYKLYTKSVILSHVKNGKELEWKNLDKIWNLLGNEEKFENYITEEINLYLKKVKNRWN